VSATADPELVVNVFSLLRRRWVCGVVRSGFHNGAGCSSTDEPFHDPSWDCGWRFELSVSDTPQNRARLGITDEIAAQL